MRRRSPGDALRLEPDVVAWHQQQSFVADPGVFAERLALSPLFSGEFRRGRGRAEWVRLDDEADDLPFPLGRVTVHDAGILLEAFSEARIVLLRARVQALGAGTFAPDETRTFPLEAALAHPAGLLQPLEEKRGSRLEVRDVAEAWLRMAWPFIPRPDLGNRPPAALPPTERGRGALESVLGALRAELADIPAFPVPSEEALRRLVVPRTGAPESTPPRLRPRVRGASGS